MHIFYFIVFNTKTFSTVINIEKFVTYIYSLNILIMFSNILKTL
jgi:hypothetical protein